MKLIGFKRNDFSTKEGTTITGYSLYLAYPATGPEAQGVVAEHIYMTDAKLAKCGLDAGKLKVERPPPPVRGARWAVLLDTFNKLKSKIEINQ